MVSGIIETKRMVADFGIVKQIPNASRIPSDNILRRDVVSAFQDPVTYSLSRKLGVGDIYRGKRTWDYELEKNSVVPTLKSAVAGDITFALGYRTMVSILDFIRAIDKVDNFVDSVDLITKIINASNE